MTSITSFECGSNDETGLLTKIYQTITDARCLLRGIIAKNIALLFDIHLCVSINFDDNCLMAGYPRYQGEHLRPGVCIFYDSGVAFDEVEPNSSTRLSQSSLTATAQSLLSSHHIASPIKIRTGPGHIPNQESGNTNANCCSNDSKSCLFYIVLVSKECLK
ncbi:hypothetical protein RB195_019260 [Necator americanus]|uniref:Uncharacterized protein n=1 Tax=Necator americanus TaxID=51031 RepID=A0ABR1CGW7_NECAM